MRTRFATLAAIAAALPLLGACGDVTAPTPAQPAPSSSASFQFGIATGGGVSGGGGAGGGGGKTTPPPAASGSCATITSFSNSTGYYSVWAAIWTSFSYTSTCSDPVTMSMTYLNGSTGLIDFTRGAGFVSSGTIDEDWAAFSTAYTVTMTLSDAAGTVLDSRSTVITTKAGKTPGA